VEYVIYPLVH